MIYGAYTGWHAPIYFVDEDANAVKNISRAILNFFLCELSLLVLRHQQPSSHSPFRAIGCPYLLTLVCLVDLGLLIAIIPADPMSGVYMVGLIAVCIPVGIILHRRHAAVKVKMGAISLSGLRVSNEKLLLFIK